MLRKVSCSHATNNLRYVIPLQFPSFANYRYISSSNNILCNNISMMQNITQFNIFSKQLSFISKYNHSSSIFANCSARNLMCNLNTKTMNPNTTFIQRRTFPYFKKRDPYKLKNNRGALRRFVVKLLPVISTANNCKFLKYIFICYSF